MPKVPDRPATTVDFGPLLDLRDEYDKIGAELCDRIVAGDAAALAAGRSLLAREDGIRDAIEAQLRRLYRPRQDDRRTDTELSDAFNAISLLGVDATGDLCTAIDNPEQYEPS